MEQSLEVLAVAKSHGGPVVLPEPSVCDPEPAGVPPRPLWSEIPKVPDYQNVANHFQLIDSIQLLASIFTKATTKLTNLKSDANEEWTKGRCTCKDGQSPWQTQCASVLYTTDKTREQCTNHCQADTTGCSNQQVLVWAPEDVFKNDRTAQVKFALELIGWLDNALSFLNSTGFAQALQVMGNITDFLENAAEILALVGQYINKFTEGYHLGAYDTLRPALHMCVGYGGHGVYAQMANLANGKASIGARYSSHNLSVERRAQFRSGGFGVEAFGKTLSILPSVEANIQLDGFRAWNAQAPFGITALGSSGGGINVSTVNKYDVFHLVDDTQLGGLDSSGDGLISGSEFLIESFYPFQYTSAQSGTTQEWPRTTVDVGWENDSAAVISAGLNLDLKMKPIEKTLPAIPIFTGATIIPYFKLAAGVGWLHEAFKLRKRIQDQINKNLPASEHLSEADFLRNMHAFQGPDVTEDNGTKAYVKPELGADLLFGLNLSKFLRMGIFARIGLGVNLAPGGYGGLVDLNYALAQTLLHSNPPADEPCTAVWSQEETNSCSNKLYPESKGNYSCTRDSKNSCCVSMGKLKLCIDDWTGIKKDQCLAKTEAAAKIESFRKYIGNKLADNLLALVGKVPLQATWNAGKTCAEAKCGLDVADGFAPVSACEQRGICEFRDERGNVTHTLYDLTQEECENDKPEDYKCVATYRDNPLSFQERSITNADGSFAFGNAVSRVYPTTVPSSYHIQTIHRPNHRTGELNLAKAQAALLKTEAACTSIGWCWNFKHIPAPSGTSVTLFLPSYTGVATSANGCVTPTNPLTGAPIVSSDNGQPMPSQHIPFEWKNEGGHGRKGTWLPYQCVESITPTVVGWEGPGCSPLSAGYASACGCADNTDCAPSEYCQDNRCVNTATGSNSCACDPAGLSAPATCSSGRTCHQGACVKTCAVASDCSASLTCDNGLCVPQWGIPLAEQITWGMSNVQAPMHAVSTYALSDLELSAYLAAGIKIELALKLLGKVKKFTIWEWKDMWDLASTNKTWYQPGLEAQYQAQCSMNAGAVENYQPVKVTRYPDPNINASYDELDELLAWCFPELESHADNPPAPTNDDLTGSINDVLDWGTDIGLDIWSSQQLCINGQLWTDWAQNAQGSLSNLTCEYKDPHTGVTTTFPCTDIMPNLLHAWGCLRTNASTFAGLLASQFPSLVVNVGGQPTFNWTAMLIDPTGELSLSNLLPSIRFFSKMFVSSIGEKWLAKVEQCFDARYDVESLCHCQAASDCNPGETCQGGLCKDSNGDATQCPIVTISVSQVGPCCGDGVVLPTEECDDGNTVDGDGCSSTCKKQDVNPRGACCTAKGCTFLPQRECQAAGGEFHVGKTCAQINECRPAITGACCGKDGCQSPVEVDACKASGGVAHAGKSCHEINYCAPGEEPGDTQGACCIRGICYEGVEIKACELKGGNAYAGRMCSQVECRSVEPTVGACCLDGACTDGVYAEKCQGAGGMLHVNMTCAAVNYCKTARPYSGEYSAR